MHGVYLLSPAPSLPDPSVLPPLYLSHPAVFAQNWGRFPSGVLWNKPSEHCVPNGNARRGNSMQEANVFAAFKLLPVTGSRSEAV